MRVSRLLRGAILAAAAIALSACGTPGGPVIAPVTREAGSLDGTTVQLVVGQSLDIGTGDLPVDTYSGEVEDPSIAEFVPGSEEDGATYNPGVEALRQGSTTVVLSSTEGGVEDVTFTVEVAPAEAPAPGGY